MKMHRWRWWRGGEGFATDVGGGCQEKKVRERFGEGMRVLIVHPLQIVVSVEKCRFLISLSLALILRSLLGVPG